MKQFIELTLCSLWLLALVGLMSPIPGLAAPFQSDTFSGTTINNSKWQLPYWSAGNGALTQNNGLYYHNNNSGTSEDEAELYSQGVGSVTNDWSVWFDAQVPNLSQINANGHETGLTLKIWNSANSSNRFDIQTFVSQVAGYGKVRTVGGDLTTNDWDTTDSHSVFLGLTAQSLISMAASWEASTKVFSTWYAPSGGGTNWILLGSWNLGVGSPTAWNLDPAQGFGLFIGGGSANVNLRTNDNVRIRNFTVNSSIITGRVPPIITTGSLMGGPGDFYPLPGATLGSAYSLTLQATGGVTPYSWSVIALSLPPGLSLATNGTISGRPTALGTSNFRVRVTGADGAYSENGYSITVRSTPTHPPSITAQPQNGTNVIGTTVAFRVTAGGTAPLSYQWRKNGANWFNGGNLSGVTTTNLTIASVQTNNAGNYTVVVSNAYGSVTSSVAVLTVITSPVLSIVSSNGLPRLSITGDIGSRYALEYVTSLAASNRWQRLVTNTLASNPQYFLDTGAAGVPRRFYRAVLLP